MRGFLVKDKVPIVRWSMLPDNAFYKGEVPEGYSLAISPSKGYIVIDVDRHGSIDGFDNIPGHLMRELEHTLNYCTKNDGRHYWFKYSGSKELANKTSGKGIDLRTNKGYVVWYHEDTIQNCMCEINDTSDAMNSWVEKLFG